MFRFWQMLIGGRTQFSLEMRVFHAICITLIICVLLYAPISSIMLPPALYLILLCMAFVSAMLFYLSRFKNRHKVAALLLQICIYIALAINYFYNSGIDGPNEILFLAGLVISVTISPVNQYYIWIPLNVLLITCLFGTEFLHPHLVQKKYSTTSGRFVDVLFTYYGAATFTFIVISFVRKTFVRQRIVLEAQSAALLESNKTKNKLLAILGHDLKEPLAALQGYLELLENIDLEADEKREINDQLLMMTKNTSLMLSNILAWAYSHEQDFVVDKKVVQVADTLKHTLQITGGICHRKRISFQYDIAPDAGILGDAQMFELIVRNILMNAVKFTQSGGDISLSAKNKGQYCIISIKDNGVGIPLATQADIFSFNIKSSRGTHSEKGNGVGLRLCKEFTERMGGDLSFVSKVGIGTTFVLQLPAVYLPYINNDNANQKAGSLFTK